MIEKSCIMSMLRHGGSRLGSSSKKRCCSRSGLSTLSQFLQIAHHLALKLCCAAKERLNVVFHPVTAACGAHHFKRHPCISGIAECLIWGRGQSSVSQGRRSLEVHGLAFHPGKRDTPDTRIWRCRSTISFSFLRLGSRSYPQLL